MEASYRKFIVVPVFFEYLLTPSPPIVAYLSALLPPELKGVFDSCTVELFRQIEESCAGPMIRLANN